MYIIFVKLRLKIFNDKFMKLCNEFHKETLLILLETLSL